MGQSRNGGLKYDQAFGVLLQAPQEGFILMGSTVSIGRGSRNLWIVPVDASGNILWQKVIGLSGAQKGLHAIIRTNDGGKHHCGKNRFQWSSPFRWLSCENDRTEIPSGSGLSEVYLSVFH